jgi:hypothetical protein
MLKDRNRSTENDVKRILTLKSRPSRHFPRLLLFASKTRRPSLESSIYTRLYCNMLFTLVLLTGLASAAPALHSRQVTAEYAPWQITAVRAGAPSGRPGNNPNSSLSITINEPNTIRIQQAPSGYAGFLPYNTTCSWAWEGAVNFPYGVETLCSPVDSTFGNFTMTLSKGSGGFSPQGDFVVNIKETKEMTVFQQRYVRVFEGEQAFKTGDNLRQVCGSSGVCSWGLKDGTVEVKQDLTTSIGSCEEADIGGC